MPRAETRIDTVLLSVAEVITKGTTEAFLEMKYALPHRLRTQRAQFRTEITKNSVATIQKRSAHSPFVGHFLFLIVSAQVRGTNDRGGLSHHPLQSPKYPDDCFASCDRALCSKCHVKWTVLATGLKYGMNEQNAHGHSVAAIALYGRVSVPLGRRKNLHRNHEMFLEPAMVRSRMLEH